MARTIILLIMLSIAVAGVTHAEPASEASVRQLLQDSDAAGNSMRMMQRFLPTMKRMVPGAPDQLWDDALNDETVAELIESLVPVYQKYLTEEDVQAINAFNQTPAGKKLLEVRPLITEESGRVGQQWAQDIARRVVIKYRSQQAQ